MAAVSIINSNRQFSVLSSCVSVEATDHADGSTTDGQSTDGGDTEEEQEVGATADTGTAADASTDTQDDGTEN